MLPELIHLHAGALLVLVHVDIGRRVQDLPQAANQTAVLLKTAGSRLAVTPSRWQEAGWPWESPRPCFESPPKRLLP